MNTNPRTVPSAPAIALAFLLGLLLAGCDQQAMLRMLIPKDGGKVAQYYIGLLRQGDFIPIERDLDPAIGGSGVHDQLVKMASLFPSGDPTSLKIVGAHTYFSHDAGGDSLHQWDITYEYQFPGKWILITFMARTKGNVFTITGFHVNPLPDSLENLNRFTLAGKSGMHYLVLLLVVFIPLFSLYWLVVCARSKVKWKRLWMLFILFGIGTLSMNWTSGQWGFNPLSFNLLGAGAFRNFYGPWTISVSFPLGAVLFMFKRRQPGDENGD